MRSTKSHRHHKPWDEEADEGIHGMDQEHLAQFSTSVEESLKAACGLTQLAVDPEGDRPFTL